MIQSNENSTYHSYGGNAVKGFATFKKGEPQEARDILYNAAGPCFDSLFDALSEFEFLMLKQARCFEEMGNEESVISMYNCLISDLFDFKRATEHGIRTAVDTYKFRYGKQLKLEKDNAEKFAKLVKADGKTSEDNDFSVKRRKLDVPANRRDPLSLPIEICSQILLHLSTCELSIASQVSHDWHDKVLAISNFLTRPTFTENMSVPHLRSYLKMCQKPGVEEMTMLALKDQQQLPLLKCLADSNLSIRALKIRLDTDFQEYVDDLAISSIERLEINFMPSGRSHIGRFVDCFPSIRHLSIALYCPPFLDAHFEGGCVKVGDLDSFKLSGIDMDSKRIMVHYFLHTSSFGRVKKLSFTNVPFTQQTLGEVLSQTHPEALEIDRAGLGAHAVLWELNSKNIHLAEIKLGRMNVDCYGNDFTAFSGLASAHFLNISLPEPVLHMLLEKADLKELSFSNVESPPYIAYLLPLCPSLESLSVDPYQCDDALCEELGQALTHAPHLKKLGICSENVTISGLKSIRRPGLTLLLHRETLTPETTEYLSNSGYSYVVGTKEEKLGYEDIEGVDPFPAAHIIRFF